MGRERRFTRYASEDFYFGDDYLVALQEGTRYRTDFTGPGARERLANLERTLVEMGFMEAQQ